ncbi:deoxyguanosinetriphosphate triphosphohydrolase family protein [Acidobacteriota bacterium]
MNIKIEGANVINKNEIFSKIVINNFQRDRQSLVRYACKNIHGIRKSPEKEKIPDRKNIRPIFFHDADKIMHSHAYSRYIDKTQVFSLFENDHITHRVLHVQFVSKIGRVIGRCLGLNEDLIEAIALGHDLGHVPYGHDGERILNEICGKNKIGFFCHNAQSVKLLMEIENGGKGLNLSLQVLDGILSHNGEILSEEYRPHYTKTWEEFEQDYMNCFQKKDHSKKIVPMTLEGCVVRIADIIAYIGRDIEDAITLKLIKRNQIPHEIKRNLGNSNDKIINNLVLDLLENSFDKNYLKFSEDVFKALKDLMAFNNDHIYLNPRIKTQAHKIENMFKQLFNKFYRDLKDNDKSSDLFHHFLKDLNDDYLLSSRKPRIVIDFISGMTDDYFNNQFTKVFVPQSFGLDIRQAEALNH